MKKETVWKQGTDMVAINPQGFRIIKLSKEEQQVVLQYCPYLDSNISCQIANSVDGTVQLLDYEAHRLRAVINDQISRMTSEEQAQEALCKVSNKLSPNPAIASMSEELAGRDFKSIDELQKEVAKINERYNNTPDPEMAGLTPNQVFRLVNLPWDSDNFAIRFNQQLDSEDVQGSYFYKNSRLLLGTLIQLESENTATVTGNLSRKALEMLFGKIILREADKPFITKFDRSFNENNAYTIHETKIICQMANLFRKTGRKFLVTKKYQKLLLDENAGELYYLLFSTFFRRFNIAYRDGFGALYSIQSTMPFSFYMLQKCADSFCRIEELGEKIFLPAVRKEIVNQRGQSRDVEGSIHTRIIEPLLSFGLIEVVRGSNRSVFNAEAVKKTVLFDKFMKFSL